MLCRCSIQAQSYNSRYFDISSLYSLYMYEYFDGSPPHVWSSAVARECSAVHCAAPASGPNTRSSVFTVHVKYSIVHCVLRLLSVWYVGRCVPPYLSSDGSTDTNSGSVSATDEPSNCVTFAKTLDSSAGVRHVSLNLRIRFWSFIDFHLQLVSNFVFLSLSSFWLVIEQSQRMELYQLLPRNALIASTSLRLTAGQERLLDEELAQQLAGVPNFETLLMRVYSDIASEDPAFTGFVHFHQLSSHFGLNQVCTHSEMELLFRCSPLELRNSTPGNLT